MLTRAWPYSLLLAFHLFAGGAVHAGESQPEVAVPSAESAQASAPSALGEPSLPVAPPVVVAAPPPVAYRPALPVSLLTAQIHPVPVNPQRGTGIIMVVVGTVIQFTGVSLLVPAVWHGAVEHDSRFPVAGFGAVGGSLVGVGNVIEIWGWTILSHKPEKAQRTLSQEDR